MITRRNLSRNSSLEDACAMVMEDEEEILNDAEQQRPPSPFVIQVTAIASLGGILFGYDLGVISGALPQLAATFDLSSSQQEVAVSILYLGGGVGAMVGGSICDLFGRKRAILMTDVIFLIGALILYAAPTFQVVVLGRVVLGFAIAVSGIADVSYLHEIAPVQWRGAIVSVNEACISLGFLLAFAIGSIFSGEGTTDGWRAMFGISGFVALLQLIGMWTMPESPTWLKEQGRHEESEAAFRRINSEYVMFTELQERRPSRRLTPASYDAVEVQNAVERSASQSSFRAEVPPSSIIDFPSRCLHFVRQALFLLQQLKVFAHETVTQYRRQAYIALFLSVTQQFCGQTVVLSYAPTIFATAGGRNHASSSSYVRGWATLSIGLVKFVVTVLVIWKIELVGRRFLLLFGMATIAGGLLLLALAFGGTSSDETLDENRLGALFALPGVLLVVCGYSMSFGPLTWLLTSELFPTDIRGRALGASTIVTYLCAAVVTYTFLSAQEIVGPSVVFAFYLLVTCLGLVFAFAAIPDTKEKSVEEIEDDLGRMLWWKGVDRLSPQTGDASPLFGSATAENESSLNIPEAVLT